MKKRKGQDKLQEYNKGNIFTASENMKAT